MGTGQIFLTIAYAIWGIVALYVAAKFAKSVRVVPTQKAFIVERLGRYHATLGPGLHLLLPFIDRVSFIQDLREVAITVPPQSCFTKDNVKHPGRCRHVHEHPQRRERQLRHHRLPLRRHPACPNHHPLCLRHPHPRPVL